MRSSQARSGDLHLRQSVHPSIHLTVSGHFHHKQAVLGSQGDPLPICTQEEEKRSQAGGGWGAVSVA